MKKFVILVVIFVSALIVVQIARYSARTTAIAAEWIALIAAVFLIFLAAKAIAGTLLKTSSREGLSSNAEAALELGISSRELEVLNLVAEGLSNKQISERLFVSEHTVKKHLSNLFSKLDAERRTEAVRIAFERNLLSRT